MQIKDQSKLKVVTFSYDDGTTRDVCPIELMNQIGMDDACRPEAFFKLISGKEDLFYGANAEVLL